MILDLTLPKDSDFRRYSWKIVILDVFLLKYGSFKRYSIKMQCFQILFYQNTVILDVIPQNWWF